MLGGRSYDFYYNGPKLHMIVLHEHGGTYWVVNSLLDNISNETMIAIAKGLRPLEGEEVAFAPMARIAFFGAGYAGLVSGACFAELGHTVVIRDVVSRADRGAARRARPVLRAGPRGADRAQRASACPSRSRWRRRSTAASSSSSASARRRPRRATPNLSAVWSVIEDLPPDLGPVVLVMKSTVPVGTGEKVRAELDRRGPDAGRLRVVPGVPRRGHGRARLPGVRPRRRRFVRPARTARPSPRCTTSLDAPVVRMDVPSAEMVKLAANAYLATRI